MEHKEKNIKEIESLNTRNLLAYYKAERQRFYKYDAEHLCGCCGEYIFNKGESEKKKKFFNNKEQWEAYLNKIKSILSKRENVIKNESPVKKNKKIAVKRR